MNNLPVNIISQSYISSKDLEGDDTVEKVINGINESVKYILCLLFAVLITAVFSQVIFRFVIEQPLAWTEELARYCLVWITFLGAAFAMSRKAHIGLEFLKNLMPNKGQKILSVLAALIGLSFFIIMLFQGYELMSRSMTQLSPVLRIPMGVIYSVLPISALLLIINTIAITIRDVQGGQQ